MSRGPGRLMRRVVEEVEKSPKRKLNRRTLEETLTQEGYDRSHILRSIRTLHRMHLVGFNDARHLESATVSLPQPVERVSDEEIFQLIPALKASGV